jgi:glycerophosphoryl diester phosphodiesterase
MKAVFGKTVFFLSAILALTACGTPRNVIAHRGFWNCEEGGWSQNSLAAHKAAFEHGLWCTELDCRITADDVIILNHGPKINGKSIETHNYADFSSARLPNGEHYPTLDEFLTLAEQYPDTRMIIEFKFHLEQSRGRRLVDDTFALLKKHGLDDPDRVSFLTYYPYIMMYVSRHYPQYPVGHVFFRNITPGLKGKMSNDPLRDRDTVK